MCAHTSTIPWKPKRSTNMVLIAGNFQDGISFRILFLSFTFSVLYLAYIVFIEMTKLLMNDLSTKHTPDWKGGFWLTAGDSCVMGAGW